MGPSTATCKQVVHLERMQLAKAGERELRHRLLQRPNCGVCDTRA